jgi:hypothetical protein
MKCWGPRSPERVGACGHPFPVADDHALEWKVEPRRLSGSTRPPARRGIQTLSTPARSVSASPRTQLSCSGTLTGSWANGTCYLRLRLGSLRVRHRMAYSDAFSRFREFPLHTACRNEGTGWAGQPFDGCLVQRSNPRGSSDALRRHFAGRHRLVKPPPECRCCQCCLGAGSAPS